MKVTSQRWIFAPLLAALIAVAAGPAGAAEIKVMVANALKEPFLALHPP